jgi:hypothetical protein
MRVQPKRERDLQAKLNILGVKVENISKALRAEREEVAATLRQFEKSPAYNFGIATQEFEKALRYYRGKLHGIDFALDLLKRKLELQSIWS